MAATRINSKPWSKASREKSAEVIVPAEDGGREGLWCAVGLADNPTEVYIHKDYRMKERMQKISTRSDNCPQTSRPEAEGYAGR